MVRLRNQGGFTLLEIIITSAFFATAFIAVFTLFASVSQQNARARNLSHATQLAGKIMEYHRNYPCSPSPCSGYDSIPVGTDETTFVNDPLAAQLNSRAVKIVVSEICVPADCTGKNDRKRVEVAVEYTDPTGTRRRVKTVTEIGETGINYTAPP